jgi:ribonuclease BN (tRNA processing enzyme)
MQAICEALFPGMHVMTPTFPLTYLEWYVGKPQPVLDLVVTPYPARHTWQTHPTALRVDVAGTVVAYTGEGEWTAELAKLGQGADLLIAESYFYSKPVKWHLNYPEFHAHKDDFGAKRVILTHMSREMLAHVHEVPEVCAEDGLVVDVDS